MTHKIQINDEIREATPEEAAAIEAEWAMSLQIQADLEAKAALKATVLAKLGLTADEAAALIG